MNNIYPNCEAYMILACPGAGSHFMQNCLANFYYDMDIQVSENGDAHIPSYEQNLDPMSIVKTMYAKFDPDDCRALRFEPIDPNKPVFLMSHKRDFNYNKFFRRYPQGKSVIITNELEDMPRILFNIFVKNVIPRHENLNVSHNIKQWANLVKDYDYFKNKHPNDLTAGEIKDWIDFKMQNIRIDFTDAYYIVNKFKDRVCKIKYKDLIANPEPTLSTLSNFVNKPINYSVHINYKSYLDKQKELISTKAPWIPNYE